VRGLDGDGAKARAGAVRARSTLVCYMSMTRREVGDCMSHHGFVMLGRQGERLSRQMWPGKGSS